MSQPESRLQRRIRAALEERFGGFWYKVWGGPFQPAGIPDLAGVVGGHAAFVEVKRPEGVVSKIQLMRMRQLRGAGATVVVARSPEEAIAHLDRLWDDGEERCIFCLSCEQPSPLRRDLPTCSLCGGER